MSEQESSKQSYISLGRHLRQAREQSRQSLAEVSGAVEIDEATLSSIEAGQQRPSEDILLLLINYFDVQDQEAVQLWELGNYDGDLPEELQPENEPKMGNKAVVMLMAMDLRTMYSDGFEVLPGKTGLTLQFTQTASDGLTAPVARVGMSYEQAQQVLRELQISLLKAKYRQNPPQLPPSTTSSAD